MKSNNKFQNTLIKMYVNGFSRQFSKNEIIKQTLHTLKRLFCKEAIKPVNAEAKVSLKVRRIVMLRSFIKV